MNMLMHTRQIAPEFWKGYWKHSIGFDRMVDTLMDTEGSFKAFHHMILLNNQKLTGKLLWP